MIRYNSIFWGFVFLFWLSFFSPCNALVTVKVKDPAGLPVSSAIVSLTNERTLKQFSATTDSSGKCTFDATVTSIKESIAEPFSLGQNFPNPFNPSTVIPFTLTRSGKVQLIVYNVFGQTVRTIVNGFFSSGFHTLIWDGRDDHNIGVGAGIYIYRLRFEGKNITRKMLLLDGNVSPSLFNGISTGKGLLKPSASTFTIDIRDIRIFIEPLHITGITVIDGNTNEYTVNYFKTVSMNGLNFVYIPGGKFLMGDEIGDLKSMCSPVHSVTVSSFQMSEAEITNEQYCAWLNAAFESGDITAKSSSVTGKKGAYSGKEYIYLDGTNSSSPDARCWIKYAAGKFTVETGKEKYPVAWVTWFGSKALAEYYGWDLPHEGEWEYACRGGKQYLYGTDDGTISSDKINYAVNGLNHPVNVKSYPPNPFGIYDMSGNVWEECTDWNGDYTTSPAINPVGAQTGIYRMTRGGGWGDSSRSCRAAMRDGLDPGSTSSMLGFRVVRR
jgi:formylglycine-generating enzyme required for sulfatase activity